MNPRRQQARAASNFPHFVEFTAIDPHSFLNDLAPHQLLGDAFEHRGQRFGVAVRRHAYRIVFGEFGDRVCNGSLHLIQLLIPLRLGVFVMRQDFFDRAGAFLGDEVFQGGIDFGWIEVDDFNAQFFQQIALFLDQVANRFVTKVDRLDHVMLGQLVGSSLHHDDAIGGTGHDQIQVAHLNLVVGRVNNKVIAN